MAMLQLKYIPDPDLRTPASAVSTFGAGLHTFLDNMYETMLDANGLGLAAPQVGRSEQIAIIDISLDCIQTPFVTSLSKQSPEAHLHRGRLELINPEIIERSARIVSSEEGCLSIPDYRDTIKRHEGVTVQAQDRLGRLYKVAAIELLAFALQHEIDHLHGTLFVDHLSRLKKVLFRKWCAKKNVELEA